MIILFWTKNGWYCCPVYYSLQNTGLGDCSLKCGLAQSIDSNSLWNTKIKMGITSWYKSKVGRPHTISSLKCRCVWCKLGHFICLLLIVTIGPWFSMYILIRFSLGNYNFSKIFFLLWDFIDFQLIFTIIPLPVPWNIFILFGTYRYTSHLLFQLSLCTIFQGRH